MLNFLQYTRFLFQIEVYKELIKYVYDIYLYEMKWSSCE